MASVTYEQVTKSFGDVEVIKGIDLDIRDGELVVFVGPSGCGKSTLLRMIAGLETPTTGNLMIGDTNVNNVPSKNRDIAMVFQNYALYPHMTVSDNISFGLKLRGVGKEERTQAAREAAALLGIEDLLDRRPRALSGGQRQRVAMGRAIVRNPAVFLMDEPLSNLDAKLRTQMRVEIRKLQHRLQTTTIFVTHDQVEAMTLADRIAVLDGGYVQQFGTPSDLYHQPINKFVAAPAARIQSVAKIHEVDIGIRPEYVKVVDEVDRSQAGTVSWQASVSLAESLGSEVLVYVQLGGQDITLKIAGARDFPEGSNINLAFNIDQAHLFCANDGSLLSSAAC